MATPKRRSRGWAQDASAVDLARLGDMLEMLNRYSHGLASIPFIHALRESGWLESLEEGATFSSAGLAHDLSANSADLDVALRLLVCLGWLRLTPDGRYTVTQEMAGYRVIPGKSVV